MNPTPTLSMLITLAITTVMFVSSLLLLLRRGWVPSPRRHEIAPTEALGEYEMINPKATPAMVGIIYDQYAIVTIDQQSHLVPQGYRAKIDRESLPQVTRDYDYINVRPPRQYVTEGVA